MCPPDTLEFDPRGIRQAGLLTLCSCKHGTWLIDRGNKLWSFNGSEQVSTLVQSGLGGLLNALSFYKKG